MRLETVSKAPARRRRMRSSEHPRGKRKPVIDVPVIQSDSNAIATFKKEHAKWFNTYLRDEWAEEATQEVIDAVIMEVAECRILHRTAKSSEFWDTDTIEFIIDTFERVRYPKDLPPKLKRKHKLSKRVIEARSRPVTMGNSHKRRTSRKGQPRTTKGRGRAIPVSMEDIEKAKGNQKWELAVVMLKESGKFWCQSQDTAVIAKTLRSVNAGLHDLPRHLKGVGSRSYGRDKLARGLAMVREILPEGET